MLARMLCLALLIGNAAPSDAQDKGLSKPAETVEEVHERLDKTISEANQKAVSDLEQIAKRAVANGELADAAKAWDAVLAIDLSNEQAGEFFKAIGKPKAEPSSVRRDDRKTWRHSERPNEGFFLTRDGWVQIISGTRYAWKETRRNEYAVYLERPGNAFAVIYPDAVYWRSRNGTWGTESPGKWIR